MIRKYYFKEDKPVPPDTETVGEGQETEHQEFDEVKMDELITFFSNGENIDDDQIHELADKLDMNPHEFEEEIYNILSNFFGGGKAKEKGITEADVDPDELTIGIEVELEHLNPNYKFARIVAKKIALDHLSEFNKYYTYLKEMEDKYQND